MKADSPAASVKSSPAHEPEAAYDWSARPADSEVGSVDTTGLGGRDGCGGGGGDEDEGAGPSGTGGEDGGDGGGEMGEGGDGDGEMGEGGDGDGGAEGGCSVGGCGGSGATTIVPRITSVRGPLDWPEHQRS